MKIPHVYLSILKTFFQCLPGILFICAAVLADQLGIDNNPDWGKGRTILLLAGLFLLGTGLIIHFYQAKKFPEKIHQNISGFISRWRSLSDFLTHNVFIALILCAALVLLMTAYAAWFTSNGKFINFPRVDNPYIDLGDAFLHGQAALLEQPDPRLLALKNPYAYEQRKNIPTYWDASLYKGKYFIYWGPVPALFYTAVQAITRTQPPGQLGIILAYLGSGSVLTALLFQLRRMFYPKTPALSLVLFLPATLINIPYLYLLGRSQVYETSIIFGQFFLFFGLLGWLIYLQSRKISWLALASLCWGLSIGSRYNLVIAVGIS